MTALCSSAPIAPAPPSPLSTSQTNTPESSESLESALPAAATAGVFSGWFSSHSRKPVIRSTISCPSPSSLPPPPEELPSSTSASRATLQEEKRTLLITQAVEGDLQLLQQRPERIRLRVRITAGAALGIHLRDNESDTRKDPDPYTTTTTEGSSVVVIDRIDPEGLLHVENPSILPGPLDSITDLLLQEGDVMESINDYCCRGKSAADVSAHLEGLVGEIDPELGLDLTLVVSTGADGAHSGLTQIFLLKSRGSKVEEETETQLSFTQRQGLLQVYQASSSILVQTGDVVVAMGISFCVTRSVEDAQLLWQMQEDCNCDCLSLLVISATEAQRRWNRVRRAAVAVGGGTLVGIGAVIMATPLHPVGHAMTLGGVGVLGTEFEGPKRAFQAAKNRFRRPETASSS